ncbi:hypothetical protein [Devosia sp.]|uniref:hypothetical protein n=1 Tax=Devosia sp. TaxID=1871048 RepID=UPI00262B7DBE|nr:hypothetical protein [Devosia sp.]
MVVTASVPPGFAYWITVATCSVVSFVISALWAVNGWPSPLRSTVNYEAVFAIMFGLFVFCPGLILFDEHIPGSSRNPALKRAFVTGLAFASYAFARGAVLLLQMTVLHLF